MLFRISIDTALSTHSMVGPGHLLLALNFDVAGDVEELGIEIIHQSIYFYFMVGGLRNDLDILQLP